MIKGLFGGKKNSTSVEIERKFLLTGLPEAKPERRHHIRQGYIARNGGTVVRVRQKDDNYILSVKTPSTGIGRYEIEKTLTADEAAVLFAACREPVIEKIREIHPHGGHIWEVDIFDGANTGLIVAEVELKSETEDIILPPWIGPEVTGLQKFYNAHIAQNPFKSWGVSYADLVKRLQG
ncbi:CYTH domain-containing protein [Paremcibacter congregatus]|uniref:CYTH domain-containing protein n=1 Tax=Paremcibacter congregatus TaxID=2043170 RepID=UPI003A926F71